MYTSEQHDVDTGIYSFATDVSLKVSWPNIVTLWCCARQCLLTNINDDLTISAVQNQSTRLYSAFEDAYEPDLVGHTDVVSAIEVLYLLQLCHVILCLYMLVDTFWKIIFLIVLSKLSP